MFSNLSITACGSVTPRMRRVDWNKKSFDDCSSFSRHASHEACGLKLSATKLLYLTIGHASHEACGLKLERGCNCGFIWSHASHEACGLKSKGKVASVVWVCHASHEACGLKYIHPNVRIKISPSRLAWGVWIEIPVEAGVTSWISVTPRMRRVDWNSIDRVLARTSNGHASHEACGLKSYKILTVLQHKQSRLAWGVWIEITLVYQTIQNGTVTPRMRRVDWN